MSTCSLMVLHCCWLTALHSCSCMVEHTCSRELEHWRAPTVWHCSSCTVEHCSVLPRLPRASDTRRVIWGASADTTEEVTPATEEEEVEVVEEMEATGAEVTLLEEVREAMMSASLGPISASTSPTTCCSLICGAARATARLAAITRRSLGVMAGAGGHCWPGAAREALSQTIPGQDIPTLQ